MNCRNCSRDYLDLYYVFDLRGNKHLVAKCECRNGAIYLPFRDNLPIPIKKTKAQEKKEKKEMQGRLF